MTKPCFAVAWNRLHRQTNKQKIHKRLKLTSSSQERDCKHRQYYTIPVSQSYPLSCLNRMISAGLKGPSARGALQGRDREKEVDYRMWEVPNRPSLINTVCVVLLCVCTCSLQLQFAHIHVCQYMGFIQRFETFPAFAFPFEQPRRPQPGEGRASFIARNGSLLSCKNKM